MAVGRRRRVGGRPPRRVRKRGPVAARQRRRHRLRHTLRAPSHAGCPTLTLDAPAKVSCLPAVSLSAFAFATSSRTRLSTDPTSAAAASFERFPPAPPVATTAAAVERGAPASSSTGTSSRGRFFAPAADLPSMSYRVGWFCTGGTPSRPPHSSGGLSGVWNSVPAPVPRVCGQRNGCRGPRRPAPGPPPLRAAHGGGAGHVHRRAVGARSVVCRGATQHARERRSARHGGVLRAGAEGGRGAAESG